MSREISTGRIRNVPNDMNGKGWTVIGISPVEIVFQKKSSSINIEADPDNVGILYVGKSDINNDGDNAFAYLIAGQSLQIDYDDMSNTTHVVASIADQRFIAGALL